MAYQVMACLDMAYIVMAAPRSSAGALYSYGPYSDGLYGSGLHSYGCTEVLS